MNNKSADVKSQIEKERDKEKGAILQRFFKTGKGEYGYGDIFVGLTVPQSRKIASQFKDLPLNEVVRLLQSKIHEERLIALLILVMQFKKADGKGKEKIYGLYLANTAHINNWDLVDLSAPKIIGEFLRDKSDRKVLSQLAVSDSIWERRIAMLATFQFIYYGDAEDALEIAEILVTDEHDLIQKAVGWMLREVGKRVSRDIEEAFLKKHYKTMPRTMLRYAIEHFEEEKRKAYLSGTV